MKTLLLLPFFVACCLKAQAQDAMYSLLLVQFAPSFEIGTWYNSRTPGSGTPAENYWQDYALVRTEVVVATGGNAYRLRVYVNTVVTPTNVKMALYSGTTRLAVSSVVAVSTTGWIEFAIPNTTISAGTYVVAFNDASANLGYDTDSASVTSTASSTTTYPTDPADPLPASEGNQNKHAVGILVN